MKLVDGAFLNWTLDPPPPGLRHKSVADCMAQALRLFASGDNGALWRLLNHRFEGRPIAEHLALAWVSVYEELAQEREEEQTDGRRWLREEEAAGYTYLLPAVYAAAAEAADSRGVATHESKLGLLVWEFDDGTFLAFEQSGVYPILWRDCSERVAAEARADEESIDREAGRAWGDPLEEPSPEAVAKLAEGPIPCRVPTLEEREALVAEFPEFCKRTEEGVAIAEEEDDGEQLVIRTCLGCGGPTSPEGCWGPSNKCNNKGATAGADPVRVRVPAPPEVARDARRPRCEKHDCLMVVPPATIETRDAKRVHVPGGEPFCFPCKTEEHRARRDRALEEEISEPVGPDSFGGTDEESHYMAQTRAAVLAEPELQIRHTCSLCGYTWSQAASKGRGVCPTCKQGPNSSHLVDVEPEKDQELANAKAAAELTLEQARAKLARNPGTVWDQLYYQGDKVPPVATAFCASCAGGLDCSRYVLSVRSGGSEVFAHPHCVEAERDRGRAEADEEQASAEAEKAKPPGLVLAEGAEHLRPFKARLLKKGQQPCEICLRQIQPGELQRRKSKTSSKRMHDACVLQALQLYRDGNEAE